MFTKSNYAIMSLPLCDIKCFKYHPFCLYFLPQASQMNIFRNNFKQRDFKFQYRRLAGSTITNRPIFITNIRKNCGDYFWNYVLNLLPNSPKIAFITLIIFVLIIIESADA